MEFWGIPSVKKDHASHRRCKIRAQTKFCRGRESHSPVSAPNFLRFQRSPVERTSIFNGERKGERRKDESLRISTLSSATRCWGNAKTCREAFEPVGYGDRGSSTAPNQCQGAA